MNAPEISVLMPTYNYASYLPEAIASVLAQDFQHFEFIIIDDASPDDTTAVVERYTDPRIRFIRNANNLGMVANWNKCLSLAQGNYVKYLFGDDTLPAPSALRQMHDLLEAQSTAAMAASARQILNASSRVIETTRTMRNGIHAGRRIIVNSLLESDNPIGEPSAVMFRRELAGRGFDPSYKQFVDLEMWFHLLEKGDLVYTREPLCAFRRHAQQQTAVNTATFSLRENLMLMETYASRPWISKTEKADILYRTSRALRRDPTSREQFTELEKSFGNPSYLTARLKYPVARQLKKFG